MARVKWRLRRTEASNCYNLAVLSHKLFQLHEELLGWRQRADYNINISSGSHQGFPFRHLELTTEYLLIERIILNSYSSRTRRIWADIYNQRGRRPYQLISGKSEKNNCFSKLDNSLDFFGWNLLKSWHFLYQRRRKKFFFDLQNSSTRNSPSAFSLLGQT